MEQLNTDLIEKIFVLLRSKDSITEQEISAKTGLEPGIIQSCVTNLGSIGYQIEQKESKYSLKKSPDVPYPWEFPDRLGRFFYFGQTDSTMIDAKKLADSGAEDFSVVIAGKQSKGRGRMSRSWVSDDGGLYFTIVLRPEFSPELSYRINFAASLVMVIVLRKMFGVNAKVKWPNDILVNENKICGMISEMEIEKGLLKYVNVGIGLNVNNDPTGVEPNSTSLFRLIGRKVNRNQVLRSFLDEFQKRVKTIGSVNPVSEWRNHTITIGRKVTVVTVNDTVEGLAKDVDDDGALLVLLSDGSEKQIIYGDCFHS